MSRLTRVKASLTRKLLSPPLVLLVSFMLLGAGLYTLWRFEILWSFLDGRPFNLATFVLAVMAIIFGSIQFRDSRRHSGKMEDIANSMSTRYIGVFPKDLEDIVEVVASADRELLIMADFVDYGHYSKPEGFERFLNEVTAARRRGVTVQILTYGETPATQALQWQFPADKFKAEQANSHFTNFFFNYSGIRQPTTHEEFLNILRRKEREVTSQLFDKGVDIRFLQGPERLFFWVEDGEDAVFSFENIGTDDPLCFRTRDGKLIETFRCIFGRNWESAQGYLTTVTAAKVLATQRGVHQRVDIRDLPAHSVRPDPTPPQHQH